MFLIGHWRSGTTHLANLLGCASDIGYVSPIATGLPWDFLVIGHLFRPLLEQSIPAERYVDGMGVSPTAPQEDEFALASMTDVSFLHGIYFPLRFRELLMRGLFFDGCSAAEIARWQWCLRHFVDKLSLEFGGQQVLIKNPAHTPRIDRILEIYPHARFIHLIRNPYQVFESTQRFMRRMLELLALQPFDHVNVDAVVLDVYPRMMAAAVEGARRLPKDQFIEVRFDDLEAAPREEAMRLHEWLGLSDRDGFDKRIMGYLDTTKGYSKRTSNVTPETIACVEQHWGMYIDHWRYRSV